MDDDDQSQGSLAQFLEELKREVDSCESKAAATSNPLYAWLALSALWAARTAPETEGHPPSAEPFCIPAWCAEFIGPSAVQIHVLASMWDRPGADGRRKKPSEASKKVPASLGFDRAGFNAFKNLKSDVLTKRYEKEFERLRAEGKSYDQAWAAISEWRGGRDPSGTRKRVTKARQAKV